jgi:hypothetical protein
MWSGFDPELQRQWECIRGMLARQRQTPSREWPLIFVEDEDALLVVREWPDGSLTAYATKEYSHLIRGGKPAEPEP